MDGGDEAYYVIESMLPLNRDEIDSDDKSDVSDWLGLVTKSRSTWEREDFHTQSPTTLLRSKHKARL